MSCKSWGCPHCVKFRKQTATEVIAGGVWRHIEKGERLRFITVTPPGLGMTMPELGKSWNRLRATMKKHEVLNEYVAVAELQERQEPHLHLIASGEYVKQKDLSRWAEKAGFGPVVDIRAVRGAGERSLTGYLLKQLNNELAEYVTKASAAKLQERAARDANARRKQVRPVRLSKYWYPKGFKGAEQVVLARMAAQREAEGHFKDEGPWYVIKRASDGNVAVVGQPKPKEQDKPTLARVASLSGAPSAEEGEGEAILELAA
jgi:hypothetical protein